MVNSSTTAGLQMNITSDDASGVGSAVVIGGSSAAGAAVGNYNGINTSGTGPIFATVGSGQDQLVKIMAKYNTGITATYMTLILGKVTSGTATLRAGSKIYYRLSA
jgi:hypothetical protein